MSLTAGAAATANLLPFASLPRRLGALLYEALLLVAIIFIASFVLLPLVSPGHAGTAAQLSVPPLPSRVAMFCALFAVLAYYCTWSWTGGRRTLPMKTWQLGLVTVHGAPLPAKAALLRYLATWIGPALAVVATLILERRGLAAHGVWLIAFNFLWAFIDRERQFLHDRIAGTRLVVTPRQAPLMRI